MKSRTRWFPLAAALVVALLATDVQTAAARGPVSYNNPFRSFNIGGVNYGSMQWERKNRSRGNYQSTRSQSMRSQSTRSGGGIFGRRR